MAPHRARERSGPGLQQLLQLVLPQRPGPGCELHACGRPQRVADALLAAGEGRAARRKELEI